MSLQRYRAVNLGETVVHVAIQLSALGRFEVTRREMAGAVQVGRAVRRSYYVPDSAIRAFDRYVKAAEKRGEK